MSESYKKTIFFDYTISMLVKYLDVYIKTYNDVLIRHKNDDRIIFNVVCLIKS